MEKISFNFIEQDTDYSDVIESLNSDINIYANKILDKIAFEKINVSDLNNKDTDVLLDKIEYIDGSILVGIKTRDNKSESYLINDDEVFELVENENKELVQNKLSWDTSGVSRRHLISGFLKDCLKGTDNH